MTFNEFIQLELKHTRESTHPNAISIRFAQLHVKANRDAAEEEEYDTLIALMQSRWRWHEASAAAQEKSTDQQTPRPG